MPLRKKQNSARKGGKKNNTQRPSQDSRPPRRRREKKAKLSTPGTMRGEMGNAVLVRQPKIGMVDLMAHKVSWICGSVYIGNGTLGATNSVYFLESTATYTNPYPVPIAGSDTLVGATYVATLEKLYRRKRYRRIHVRFLATQSSTTNNMTLTIAPIRGPPGYAELGGAAASTAAAISQAAAMSLTGSETVDSFEDAVLDLTPFIAGGAGAKQNEFAIANAVASNSALRTPSNLLGVVPAAFVVAGNSNVAALQGTNTHQVVVETVVDYLDFVGAIPAVDPEGLMSWPAPVGAHTESKEERRGRLLSELSALSRDDKGKRDASASPTRLP